MKLQVLDENPGWRSGRRGRYWTEERVSDALRRYVRESTGMLPSGSLEWHKVKKGRLDLPTAAYVIRQYKALNCAWLAVGAPKARVSLTHRPWSEEEDDYLVTHAGDLTLEQIGRRLHRSYAACKRRLYDLGTTARSAQGFMSAALVAREYGCTPNHVLNLVERGVLKAQPRRRDRYQNFLRIAPEDAEAVAEQLRHDERRPPNTAMDTWLTPAEVGDRLGLSVSAVWQYLDVGELPSIRRGRRHFVSDRALRGFVPRSMRRGPTSRPRPIRGERRILGMTMAEWDAIPAMRVGR